MTKSPAMLRTLRHKGFRRVWIGQVVNIAGDAGLLVALALLLAGGDNPATSLSVALAIIACGKIISVLAGNVLADRIRRSQLIIWSDVMGGLGSVVILLSRAGHNLVLVIVGATLIGLKGGVYQPAYQALFPSLLPREELAAGNALRTLGGRLAGIAGSAATGAAAVLFSVEIVIVANIATYAVSVLTLVALGDRKPVRTDTQGFGGMLDEARGGLAYVWEHRWICAVMVQGTVQVAFLTAPLGVLLPLALRDEDGAYGWVVATEALGAMLGAWVASRREYARKGLVAIGGASLELPLIIAVAADAPSIIICGVGFLAGFGLALFAVLWLTALQTQVPNEILGRVLSLDMLAAIGLAPVGTLLAGAAVRHLGVGPIGWICAAVLGASILALLVVPNVARFADGPGPRQGRARQAATPVRHPLRPDLGLK
ncbi:MAG TPA: MFS transporter [Kineosporiaceae bacterium]